MKEQKVIDEVQISSDFQVNLVSVIIPTYNRSNFLIEALESVFSQSYRPLEIIVIDDGSMDATESVVSAIIEKNEDEAVTLNYIRQEKIGSQAARNKGHRACRGEFIQFLDDDDLLSKNKIKNQVLALRKCHAPSVAYCKWRIFSKSMIKYGPIHQAKPEKNKDEMLHGYLSSTWYCPSLSFLFSREVVRRVGFYDEKLLRRQDTDYLIRTLLCDFDFLYVYDATVYYRRHNSSHIGHVKHYAKHFPSCIRVIEKAHAILMKQGRLNHYKNDIATYLRALADDASNVGYDDGVSIVREKFKSLLTCSDADDVIFNSSGKKSKINKNMKKLIKHVIGECGIDWLKIIFRKTVN